MLRSAFPLLLCCGLSLPSCTFVTSCDDVLISSAPLGAEILVDGTATGRTTPARLAIGGHLGSGHTIELRMPGYHAARRRVYQYTEGYTSKWIDGVYDLVMPPLPLFWTFGDLLTPFGVRSAILPGELYVELQPDDEPLLGFELLAAREQAAADATDAAAGDRR